MSGALSRDTLMDYYPTRYMTPARGDEARARRKASLHQGYLLSTPQPEVADILADDYEREDRGKAQRYHHMRDDTMQDPGYLDDLLRVLGNRASFGTGDHIEGLVNSHLYDTDVNDSLATSAQRTSRANERLGPIAGPAANLLGTLGGYATMLPRLPAWLAGRGVLTPAAIPLEMTRGYFETQGAPGERFEGALRQVANEPANVFNPMTGRGLAANMFHQPLMEHAGLGDLTPAAYLNRILDTAGAGER